MRIEPPAVNHVALPLVVDTLIFLKSFENVIGIQFLTCSLVVEITVGKKNNWWCLPDCSFITVDSVELVHAGGR